MVGEELAKDLLSFGVRILVLGDPAQLPPVKGEGFFIDVVPDVMLTEVHRQALDNPIVRMSMDVREGRGLTPGVYGDSRVVCRQTMDRDELAELVVQADQLLVGLNRTRVAYNRRVRQLKRLHGESREWHPVVGDRLICLKNNRQKSLFNGGMWSALEVKEATGRFEILVGSEDEKRDPVRIKVFDQFFLGTESELSWPLRKLSDEFTYGWAITCHKSQGSQWDNVFLFDESGAFREARMNWLYTGLTRAAERVTIVQ